MNNVEIEVDDESDGFVFGNQDNEDMEEEVIEEQFKRPAKAQVTEGKKRSYLEIMDDNSVSTLHVPGGTTAANVVMPRRGRTQSMVGKRDDVSMISNGSNVTMATIETLTQTLRAESNERFD